MAATVLDAFEAAVKTALGALVRSVFRGEANEDVQQAGRGLPWAEIIDRGERQELTSETRILIREVEVRVEARGHARADELGTVVEDLFDDDRDPRGFAVAGKSVTWCKPVTADLVKQGDKPEDGDWRWRAALVYSVRTEEARRP